MQKLFRKIKGAFIFGSIFAVDFLVIAGSNLFIWLFPVLLIAVFIYASIRPTPKIEPK